MRAESGNQAMAEFVAPLADLAEKLQKLSMEIAMKAMENPDEAGAAAVPYLKVAGHLVFAWFRARMSKIALAEQASGDCLYQAKLLTARFCYAKLLPETATLIRQARAGVETLMTMDAALFRGNQESTSSESHNPCWLLAPCPSSPLNGASVLQRCRS